MFCMLLRKHLEGAKLKDVRVVEYERIVEFYFESQIQDFINGILFSEHKFANPLGGAELKGGDIMKGYAVESGYMGYVNGTYMLFASETDYADYMAEQWAQFMSMG